MSNYRKGYIQKEVNMKPRTYDMTFCVSKCKNKCERHYSQYEFEKDRLYSISNFNCGGEIEIVED